MNRLEKAIADAANKMLHIVEMQGAASELHTKIGNEISNLYDQMGVIKDIAAEPRMEANENKRQTLKAKVLELLEAEPARTFTPHIVMEILDGMPEWKTTLASVNSTLAVMAKEDIILKPHHAHYQAKPKLQTQQELPLAKAA